MRPAEMRLAVFVHVLIVFVVAAIIVTGIVRAVSGGSFCEMYRYTPVGEVPAICAAELLR